MTNNHVHPTILEAMRSMIPKQADLLETLKTRNAMTELQLEADKATRKEADMRTTLEASGAGNLNY